MNNRTKLTKLVNMGKLNINTKRILWYSEQPVVY